MEVVGNGFQGQVRVVAGYSGGEKKGGHLRLGSHLGKIAKEK
jgi:hypothetical protein